MVFGESLGDELEVETKPGRNRAQGHQLGLWAFGKAFAVARLAEPADHSRGIGKIQIAAVDGQQTKGVFPQQVCLKSLFETVLQHPPQTSPESEGQPSPGLAKGFFGDAPAGEPRAYDADHAPGLAQALGH